MGVYELQDFPDIGKILAVLVWKIIRSAFKTVQLTFHGILLCFTLAWHRIFIIDDIVVSESPVPSSNSVTFGRGLSQIGYDLLLIFSFSQFTTQKLLVCIQVKA